ncbi:MAG TPA: DUF1552 domain-containing protein [Verrucomicrobiales bacterium]|nr:DUF1552 domain-containing protein [Verrucomicrobiales bacterium]
MNTRRLFLRGLGASIALPAFQSLAPRLRAAATAAKLATTATGAPLRTAFFFFPNGSIPSRWWPAKEGTDFEFSPSLKPLEEVRKHVQIIGGLENLNGEGGPDGAGDHARGVGTFLTGVRLKKSATDVRAGVSIDQVIARQTGHLTRLSSLELSCDAVRKSGACDSGYACAYQFNLSWSGPSSPMTPEVNPRLLFERLFGPGNAGERAQNLKRRQAEQKSVLDFVLEDARSMQRRLDARDNEKLDQYLTGLRNIEQRIEKAERLGPPPDPGTPSPAGVPENYGEHIQLMSDLMVMAFQSDLTRVASFMLAHDGSNRSFADIGISEGHHDISHHQNKPELVDKVSLIDRWYADQFAQVLKKLEAVKDTDGKSLLHNSMIIFGGGNGDPNRHNHDNLPFVLAGHGGGTLTPGRYVKHKDTPAMNMMLSLADRMGVTGVERFGDSTSRLADI